MMPAFSRNEMDPAHVDAPHDPMPARRFVFFLFPALAVFSFAAALHAAPDAREFFSNHCTDCHDAEEKKGGIDLEALKWDPADRTNLDRWAKIFDVVQKGEMPPKKRQQRPEADEVKAFLGSLHDGLVEVDQKRISAGGRTVLRRLNRVQYEHTLHDLLGVRTPLASMLPADTPFQGFDTVAEGLRLSTLQMEKYLEAADAALDAAIRFAPPAEVEKNRFELKKTDEVRWHLDKPEGDTDGKGGAAAKHRHLLRELPDAVVYFNTGYPAAKIKQPKSMPAGKYRIRISGYGYQSQGVSIPMRVYGDNYKERQLLGWFEMTADKPRVVDFTTWLPAGNHLHIEPSNSGVDEKGRNVYSVPVKDFTGAGLALQWVEIEGPLEQPPATDSLGVLFGDIPVVELQGDARKKDHAYELKPQDPKADSARALEQFAVRAFRRPLEPGEISRYTALVHTALDGGTPFLQAMRIGFRAVLTAPQFLFFEEYPGKLDDRALASRLSYFLTSSAPDRELLDLAGAGKLSDPATLRAQTERLLADPRSSRFVEDFTGQWLDLRNIDATTPDEKLYPESDELLRVSMVEETKAYFAEMVKSDLPVDDIVDSDFVMINSRLGEHYGIPGADTEEIRKVAVPPDSPRGGFLTQASILKITANGTTTSPVLRGAWVMKKLLGRPPSPPPPGVGSIEPDTRGATTVRELLEKHRSAESCAGCHAKIDPPGFALESFDVIGGYRERYRSQGEGETMQVTNSRNKRRWVKVGKPVDASGEFDGGSFSGIRDFKKLVLQDEGQLMRATAGKLVTYATGAGVSFSDREAVEEISRKTKEKGGGLRTLIHEVVQSPLFLTK